MINKCIREDEKLVLGYIGADYPRCLYLYLNLKKYGLDSDFIDMFILFSESEIKAVLLKYYSCLHVYSSDNQFDAEELACFFIENKYTMLYCAAETARKVYSAFPNVIKGKAVITEGWVAQIKRVDHDPKGLAQPAGKEDFEQIARLIYDDDDIGRSYKFDELVKQLEERNQQGYARNLVIKHGDMVIAHACTNAENEEIAVVAELLVGKEFRRKGYASEIWRSICSQLLIEGKEVYSFYYSKESRYLHKKIGFFEVCNWAKIVIE